MEARVSSIILLSLCYFAFGAGYRTENFVVHGRIDKNYAKRIGDSAEIYRRDLAKQWLGYELPRWQRPCPINVVIARHAEGRTSFSFQGTSSGKSYPTDWDMEVKGPADRILDAVLPHEVTHTIFASHFGRPLPRWADEGACTTVEHISERQKNHRMLIEFLTTNRGIPFNHMFRMKEYPRDILPLYAQGYSLTRYFIQQKGHRHFIKYLEKGMATENWNTVTREFYGFDDLSELQVSWVKWIKSGCPDTKTDPAESPADQQLAKVDRAAGDAVDQLAVNSQPDHRAAANDDRPPTDQRLARGRPKTITTPENIKPPVRTLQTVSMTRQTGEQQADLSQSWYVEQMRRGRDSTTVNFGGTNQTASPRGESRLKTGTLNHRTPVADEGAFNQSEQSSPDNASLNRREPRIECSGGVCRIIR